MISGQQEALEYLAQNYWNNVTDPSNLYPSDSVLMNGVRKADVEQKFADWTYILEAAGPDIWSKAVAGLYDRALRCEQADTSSNVFETFVALVDKYMYNPNSPMRNEDMYLHFIRKYAEYEGLSEIEKDKFRRQARLCALNRIGEKAADFRFADKRGRIRNLYDIDAELTLLFFSNPGCNACMDIIKIAVVNLTDQTKQPLFTHTSIPSFLSSWRSLWRKRLSVTVTLLCVQPQASAIFSTDSI